MQLSVGFVLELSAGSVGLAFQSIRELEGAKSRLYQEALLRLSSGCVSGEVNKVRMLEALSTIGIVRLLDYIVLSRVVAILQSNPKLRIGCNVSAKSAVEDSWWAPIFLG